MKNDNNIFLLTIVKYVMFLKSLLFYANLKHLNYSQFHAHKTRLVYVSCTSNSLIDLLAVANNEFLNEKTNYFGFSHKLYK